MRKAIVYNLELISPVLATDVQSEPNGAVSLPYVSGALLRGALVARYLLTSGKRGFDALDDSEARALFLNETTRYLNAYAFNNGNEMRMLPTPAAWRFCKDDGFADSKGRKIYNLKYGKPKKEEAVMKAYVSLNGDTARLYSPPRQINIHTQRDAVKGRSTETAGSVYRYDALAAGLQLQAAILTSEELAPTIAKLLDKATLWIGRARRAGYGHTVVSQVATFDYWHELGDEHEANEVEASTEFQITFTSDALLRDESGQAALDPRAALAAKLKVEVNALQAKPDACFVKARVVGGFNRKWGLPLPQTTAIAAGSVFAYQPSEAIAFDTIEALERDGIGERRNEGFGRLVVNWLLKPTYTADAAEAKAKPKPPEELSDAEREFATELARRLLRQKLDAELRRQVNATRIERPPNKNQLSRLRVVLRDFEGKVIDGNRWNNYLDSLATRRSTRGDFEKAQVIRGSAKHKLLAWMKDKVENAKTDWQVEAVKVGGNKVFVEARVDASLAQEYALRLIDGVLHQAAKERK